jgi:hypothetical protein
MLDGRVFPYELWEVQSDWVTGILGMNVGVGDCSS